MECTALVVAVFWLDTTRGGSPDRLGGATSLILSLGEFFFLGLEVSSLV